MIASEFKDISFIVLLAGSGIQGDKLMLLQKEIIKRKMGVSEVAIVAGQNNISPAYGIIMTSTAKGDSLQLQLNRPFHLMS